jgi:aspartate aminotransferase
MKLSAPDGFRLLPEDLAEVITPKTKMIILNSPCNPTGGVYSGEDIKGISELAVDHDFLVLSDEIYERIIYEGSHYSFAAQPEMFERTITVGGFSKAYAMTGWRVGWLIAAPEVFSHIRKLQEHSLTCATSFAQYGALEALTGPQQCVTDMVAEFKTRRDMIVQKVNEIENLSCSKPAGAFYVFIKYDYETNSDEFATYLLENAGVALTPGSGFGSAGEGYLRMSYAASQEQILEGLNRIKNTIDNDEKLKKK